jgi:hypothetical protein
MKGRRHSDRYRIRAAALTLGLVMFMIAVFCAGIAAAAVISRVADKDTWITWGNVGQTFESINAIFSGLAFAALVVTFWIQLKELREQRQELQLQREAAIGARDELRRSSLADLRGLHVGLIRFAVDDDDLAAVWPEIEAGASPVRNRQFLYANLILQNLWISLEMGEYSARAIETELRYLFSSRLMRDYWSATSAFRGVADINARFTVIADAVYRDYLRSSPDAAES